VLQRCARQRLVVVLQRDRAEGFWTYSVRLGEHGRRPASVPTLGPAPPSEVTTVPEQVAFHQQWLSELSE
jgi:hypothetical protein